MALLWTHSNRSISLLCWEPQTWVQHSRWVLVRAEGKNHLPWPTDHSFSGAAQVWAVCTHCCPMPSFLSTTAPSSPLQGCIPWVLPVCAHVWCCCKPGPSGWHPLFLLSASPLNFVSYLCLLRVLLTSLSVSLIKVLKCTSPKKFHLILISRETPIVTGSPLEIEPLTTTLWVCPSSQFLIHWKVYALHPSLQFGEKDVMWDCVEDLTEL